MEQSQGRKRITRDLTVLNFSRRGKIQKLQDVPQRGKFNSPGCSTAWKIQQSRMFHSVENSTVQDVPQRGKFKSPGCMRLMKKKKITRDPPACIINKLRLYI